MAAIICSSCKSRITNEGATRFACPGCGASEVVRCQNCKERAAPYGCLSCDFVGPN